MRKHPIAHEVRAHKRAGVTVHHYERGSGKAPRVVIGSQRLNVGPRYTVILSGESGRQALSVGAGSIPDAATQGLARTNISGVRSISIRRR